MSPVRPMPTPSTLTFQARCTPSDSASSVRVSSSLSPSAGRIDRRTLRSGSGVPVSPRATSSAAARASAIASSTVRPSHSPASSIPSSDTLYTGRTYAIASASRASTARPIFFHMDITSELT